MGSAKALVLGPFKDFDDFGRFWRGYRGLVDDNLKFHALVNATKNLI